MCRLTRVWSHCRDFHFHHTVRPRHILPGADPRGQEEPPGSSTSCGVHAVWWAALLVPVWCDAMKVASISCALPIPWNMRGRGDGNGCPEMSGPVWAVQGR